MKKPQYIEIRLPGSKRYFSLAKEKYLKNLEGKELKVNFAQHRERKLFNYKVVSSKFYSWVAYFSREKTEFWSLRLELKVPKEDLNNPDGGDSLPGSGSARGRQKPGSSGGA